MQGLYSAWVVLTGLLVLFGLAILLLALKDRLSKALWRLRNPPEKLAAQRAALKSRLNSPDWKFYQQHLQRKVPEALCNAYAAAEIVTKPHYFSDYYVTFCPIDPAAESENWLPGILPFADSNGDPIFLKPGHAESEAVYIAYHDGSDIEQLAPSVEAFISGLKVTA